jgi:RES domain
MSHLYPRERVERVLRPLSSLTLYRILLKSFASDPLAVRASPSRFCDGKSFAVLYAAQEFSTAFVEVVVRDRFVHEDDRFVGYDEVEVRASIEFKLKVPPLNLVDLSGSGAVDLGAPTDAAHARNHAAGRALARALYDHHAGVDGIWYSSRLTGGSCVALFDRAVTKLEVFSTTDLNQHPLLPDVLDDHHIKLT